VKGFLGVVLPNGTIQSRPAYRNADYRAWIDDVLVGHVPSRDLHDPEEWLRVDSATGHLSGADHTFSGQHERVKECLPILGRELVGSVLERQPDGIDDRVNAAKAVELALLVGQQGRGGASSWPIRCK
jgi:hypothetical protein